MYAWELDFLRTTTIVVQLARLLCKRRITLLLAYINRSYYVYYDFYFYYPCRDHEDIQLGRARAHADVDVRMRDEGHPDDGDVLLEIVFGYVSLS